jgi:hypothetical protein
MISKTGKDRGTEPRFLVAKYVPDLARMEPRNVGVILWNGTDASSRFLGTDAASFVDDQQTYLRWVKYWEGAIKSETLKVPRSPAVHKKDAHYLDALKKTERGNFRLLDGGGLLEGLASADIKDATDFLFRRIVETLQARESATDENETESQKIVTASREALEAVGVWNRHDFQRSDVTFPCRVHGVWKQLRFHLALGGATPKAVFQRVRIDNDSSWQTATFRFEWLLKSELKVTKDRCAAFVSASDEQLEDQNLKGNLEVLADCSTVVNLAKRDQALDILSRIAA